MSDSADPERHAPLFPERRQCSGWSFCYGQPTEISRSSHLINPGRPIPWNAHRVHGISDQDVAEYPLFDEIASEGESTLVDSWIVGHNVRFDTDFIALELQ